MDEGNDKQALAAAVVDLFHGDMVSRQFKPPANMSRAQAEKIIAERRSHLEWHRKTLTSLYAKHMSVEQLQALLDFHNSEMGRSIKEAQKRLYKDLQGIQEKRNEHRNQKVLKEGSAVISVINKISSQSAFHDPGGDIGPPHPFGVMELSDIQPSEFDQLMSLWEDSVRVSHRFLRDEDIQALRPVVRQQALPNLHLKGIRADSGELLGFIGTADDRVEALFVAPKAFGQGIGKRLMAWAEGECGTRKVDVNEQNPRAVRFYINLGYQIFGRSPLDGQGNPFPILHLEKKRP